MSSGKRKLKQARYKDTPIRMANTQNTDKNRCWWGCTASEVLSIADWNDKWYSHFGRQFLTKLNIPSTIQSSNDAPRYLPTGVIKTWSHKNLHTNVYSSFIHSSNCQIMEATKMSWIRWVDKLWHIPTTEYCSTPNQNEPSGHEETWRNLACILLSEANLKSYIMYNYNYRTFWKRQNHGDSRKTRGWRGRNRWRTEGLRQWKYSVWRMTNVCRYTFAQTHRTYNTKSEPQGKLRTLVIRMSVQVTSYKKRATLVGGVDTRRGWGRGVYMETWSSSQFCGEPKTVLKKEWSLQSIYFPFICTDIK